MPPLLIWTNSRVIIYVVCVRIEVEEGKEYCFFQNKIETLKQQGAKKYYPTGRTDNNFFHCIDT